LLLDANWFRIEVQVKKVAKGLLRSSYTPVKNSKRLLCRFFYGIRPARAGHGHLANTRKGVNQMVQGRRHGHSHVPRPSHFRHPKTYKVKCSGCGKEVVTPVPPPDDKKLLCMECLNSTKISKEE
jgi:CxxC-x17-CxxC domain-containing protein